jgi:hypothetical protein
MSGIMSLEAPRPSGENGAADWKGKNVQIFSHYGDWTHLALILLLEGALEGKRIPSVQGGLTLEVTISYALFRADRNTLSGWVLTCNHT